MTKQVITEANLEGGVRVRAGVGAEATAGIKADLLTQSGPAKCNSGQILKRHF